ncbi:MAG: hypothetical protein ACLQG5_00010 [Methanobacterium sp.]
MLGNILKIFDCERVRQEIAKQGIKPAGKIRTLFKVLILCCFFDLENSYVVRELENGKIYVNS